MTKMDAFNAHLRWPFAGAETSAKRWLWQNLQWAALLLFLFLPLPSLGVAAEGDLELAPGLWLSIPTSLSVALHPETAALLVGEIEGAPGYFMSASIVELNERDNVLWARLEAELKKSGRRVDQLLKGHFSTELDVSVTYRAYRYRDHERNYRQVYYLMKSDEHAYWVCLTAVETVHLNVILPFAEVLLKRTQLDRIPTAKQIPRTK